MKKQIKSIKQISQDIRKSKVQLDQIIYDIGIPNLTMEEDLVKRTPTIQTILKDLPSEHRLKEMLQHPYAQTPQLRQRILREYKGKYDIIKKAAENINNIKAQAQKLYYLAAELNLYKIKNQFDPQVQKDVKLKSYQIFSNQNNRIPKYEKNTVSSAYIRQMREEQIKGGPNFSPSDNLNPGDPLISVNLYDSINGQKIFEYVFYGEQTLLDMVSTFYCLIARLQNKEKNHWHNSYCLIEQNFYYNGNAARKKIEEIIAFSTQSLEEEYNMEQDNSKKSNLIFEMSKIKLKALRVVFGRPYLFRHLQGCDHIIIFKDLRVLCQNQVYDPVRKDKYPLIVFEGRMRRRKCDGCRIKFAEVVSLNDELKGGKHLYLCQNCRKNLQGQMQDQNHMLIRYIHD